MHDVGNSPQVLAKHLQSTFRTVQNHAAGDFIGKEPVMNRPKLCGHPPTGARGVGRGGRGGARADGLPRRQFHRLPSPRGAPATLFGGAVVYLWIATLNGNHAEVASGR
jgi:hypothetical protein